jgi:hypothetical protein
MIFLPLFSLLPALFGAAGAQAAGDFAQVRRVIIQDEIIVRVPVRIRRVAPQLAWTEHKGPKCIRTDGLRGAVLSGPASVDFLVDHRRRIRARFDTRCPALDFYGGFYLNTDDGKVCAGRDAVRSRAGTGCVIEEFRRLSPKPRR